MSRHSKLRAGRLADLRSFDPGAVRRTVQALVAGQLGRRASWAAVQAWSALAIAVVYSDTGTVRRGYAEMARRHGLSRKSLGRGRLLLMPPEGAPSREGLLVRPFRGRAGHGVSKWAAGDQLLTLALARLRATAAGPKKVHRRRSPLGDTSAQVAAPVRRAGRPAGLLDPVQDLSDGPAGRSPDTTAEWQALRDRLAPGRRHRRW